MAQVEELREPERGDRLGPLPDRPRAPAPVRQPPGAPESRRIDQTLVRIDPRSVLHLALVFYRRLVLAGFGLGLLIWLGAFVTGATGSLDTFAEEVTGYPSLGVLGIRGLFVALVLGLTFVLGASLVSVLVAVLFNLASEIGGGVKVTVVEEELHEQVAGEDLAASGPRGPTPRHGRPPGRPRPVLGADVTSIDTGAGSTGALVVGIEPDSPAQSAGLAPGDVIVSLDGQVVDSPSALSHALASPASDEKVSLRWVDRHGRHQSATVDLSGRSPARLVHRPRA